MGIPKNYISVVNDKLRTLCLDIDSIDAIENNEVRNCTIHLNSGTKHHLVHTIDEVLNKISAVTGSGDELIHECQYQTKEVVSGSTFPTEEEIRPFFEESGWEVGRIVRVETLRQFYYQVEALMHRYRDPMEEADD